MKNNEVLLHDGKTVAEFERELRYISTMIKQKGRELLTDFSITPPQFIALQWLFEDGDMTIGELSNKMYLACSTTTDLIDRMEKKDLLRRVRDHKDRRVVRIQLLATGIKIIEEVIQRRKDYLQGVLVNFSNKEVMELKDNLAKLHHEMKKE